MGIEAVVVDLGGVWLQDGDFTERERWASARGVTTDQVWAAYVDAVGPGAEGGRTEAEMHRRLLATLGLVDDDLDGLLTALHAHEVLDPTLTTFLTDLRPNRKVGVITNAGPSARRQLCAKFPLDELTDTIVVSAEEGVRKPDPAIYRIACNRLAVSPDECIFVDDKVANVDGARAVGMLAVHFRSVVQAIGDITALLGSG